MDRLLLPTVPDYLEDANGNHRCERSVGLLTWEVSDTGTDDARDFVERRDGRDTKAPAAVADTTGTIHFRVYTPF